MTHDELRRAIAASSALDWHHSRVAGDGHPSHAAYRVDVGVGLAWGEEDREGVAAAHSGGHPDTRANATFVDVLYHGMLVERRMRVLAGGRCHVPVPTPKFNGHKITGYTVTAWDFDLVGLLHAIEGRDVDYAAFVQGCGFQVVG